MVVHLPIKKTSQKPALKVVSLMPASSTLLYALGGGPVEVFFKASFEGVLFICYFFSSLDQKCAILGVVTDVH